MSFTKITLASGNVFYHSAQINRDTVSFALVVRGNTFLGGFMCREADRKLEIFSRLNPLAVETTEDKTLIESLDFTGFAKKLGSLESLFLKNLYLIISDYRNCDGTSSKAESCDERAKYYYTVGCEVCYKSYIEFPLWAFVANHVSIFGVENFRETFFKGKDNPEKDDFIEVNASWKKLVYSTEGFKAPAAYVRALCRD